MGKPELLETLGGRVSNLSSKARFIAEASFFVSVSLFLAAFIIDIIASFNVAIYIALFAVFAGLPRVWVFWFTARKKTPEDVSFRTHISIEKTFTPYWQIATIVLALVFLIKQL